MSPRAREDLFGLPAALAIAAACAVAIANPPRPVAAAIIGACAAVGLANLWAQRRHRSRDREAAQAAAAMQSEQARADILQAWTQTVAGSFGMLVYSGIERGEEFISATPNAAFAALLGGDLPEGADAEEFWMSRIHPDDLETYRSVLAKEQMEVGVSLDLEYRVIDLDGLVRHVFERLFPRELLDGGDIRVEGLVIDVTDQVRARNAIAASARRAHEIAQSSGAYVYEGLLYPDDCWETTFRAAPANAPLGNVHVQPGGEGWRSLVRPSDREEYDRAFSYDLALAGETLHAEYRMASRDAGERVLVEHMFPQEIRPDGVIPAEGVIFDVTDQRIAERQLGAVIESAAMRIYDGVLYPDRRVEIATVDGLLPALGHAATRTGAAHDLWLELIHPDDRERYAERLGFAAASPGEPLSAEYRVRDAHGRSATVLERLFPRERREDGGMRIDGIVLDVTELRAAERRLQSTLESLDVQIYSGDVDASGAWDMRSQAGVDDRHWLGAEGAWVGEDTWRAHIEPADRPAYDALLERVGAERKASAAEYRLRRDDGSVCHVLNQLLPGDALPDGGVQIEGIVIDITDRQQARGQLADLERRLSQVLGAVDVLVATLELTPNGDVRELFRGPGLERLLGGTVPAGVDTWVAWASRVHPGDQAIHEAVAASLRGGEAAEGQHRVVGLDGRTRWISFVVNPRAPMAGENTVVDAMFWDVTTREEAVVALAHARDEAERRLRIDPLTGVANRVHLVEQLEVDLAATCDLAVVILDLDHFKRVNDVFLHSAGDAVLCETARRLERTARPGDIVARWSGEEFVVLLRGAPSRDTLHAVAERLRQSISAQPFVLGGRELRVTASAGAMIAEPGTTVTELLDIADRALYSAKRAGRDQLRVGDELDERELLAEDPDVVRLAEAVSLAAAVGDGESELHCNLVAKLSGDVARELGLGAAAHLRCRLVGLVHDIGKMAVPASILGKPDALTAGEWEVMKQHAAFGAEIATRVPGLADAAAGVRHHHERFDGCGYPDRIAGKAIPIEARIVCAVDAWSAMSEDRVYRRALPPEHVVAELRRGSGSQFDPRVVDALCAVLARDGRSSLRAA